MRTIIIYAILLYSIAALIHVCISYSVAQSGDVEILFDGKTFKCDWITCPENTERCAVKKKTRQNDLSTIDRTVTCYGGNNKIVATHNKIEKNPNPGQSVDIHVEGDGDGNSVVHNRGSTNTNYDDWEFPDSGWDIPGSGSHYPWLDY